MPSLSLKASRAIWEGQPVASPSLSFLFCEMGKLSSALWISGDEVKACLGQQ